MTDNDIAARLRARAAVIVDQPDSAVDARLMFEAADRIDLLVDAADVNAYERLRKLLREATA